MVKSLIDLNSDRAYKARLAKTIGKTGFRLLASLGVLFAIASIALFINQKTRYGFILISPSLACLSLAIWWQMYLSKLPIKAGDLTSRINQDLLANLKPNQPISASTLWAAIHNHWQTMFIMNHLLIGQENVAVFIESESEDELANALTIATKIADSVSSRSIEPGFIAAGLMMSAEPINKLMLSHKAKPEDIRLVAQWLGRNLVEFSDLHKQNFGGIGRDWAFGYTPLLSKFGLNISLGIIKEQLHFGWLTNSKTVLSIEAALNNQARAIALVGQVGSGKSSSVYALAQRLMEGKSSNRLAYHQIILISATDVISSARRPGDIAYIMLSLANEASHAGHIILFFDNAEAFFSEGTGSFDGNQIIQSIINASTVPIIMALSPNGFEQIKSKYQTLSSLFTPIIVSELDETNTLHVLEDTAVGLENQHNLMIAYDALLACYSLSGRYMDDQAYPGKAINLLKASLPYAFRHLITRSSVEAAVEDMFGVKVGATHPIEAEELLELESIIHQRMINQDQAVSAVANALRRSRAGVTNPNRPVGSFLFLGPTGVGKTELAKALAYSYFKSEDNLIRLDMSEYQNQNDVNRLLSDGSNETKSLILSIRQKPFSVLLLDELEKAHAGVLDILLQILDEGHLTDSQGRSVSFKDCIIIATSNAGAQSVRKNIELNKQIADFHDDLIEELIKSNQFRPELINRFDEVVIFTPLKPSELAKVVNLMLAEVNTTLSNQNIVVSLNDEAITKIVDMGYDPTFGARPMRRVLQKTVENTLANKILKGEAQPGDHVILEAKDLSLS